MKSVCMEEIENLSTVTMLFLHIPACYNFPFIVCHFGVQIGFYHYFGPLFFTLKACIIFCFLFHFHFSFQQLLFLCLI